MNKFKKGDRVELVSLDTLDESNNLHIGIRGIYCIMTSPLSNVPTPCVIWDGYIDPHPVYNSQLKLLSHKIFNLRKR